MENVVLTIHLLLALALVGVVLLQRSEGGGLGMGSGGGGGDGIMSGRSAASALSKVTWILAIAFIITSLTLTVIAARNAAGTSTCRCSVSEEAVAASIAAASAADSASALMASTHWRHSSALSARRRITHFPSTSSSKTKSRASADEVIDDDVGPVEPIDAVGPTDPAECEGSSIDPLVTAVAPRSPRVARGAGDDLCRK